MGGRGGGVELQPDCLKAITAFSWLNERLIRAAESVCRLERLHFIRIPDLDLIRAAGVTSRDQACVGWSCWGPYRLLSALLARCLEQSVSAAELL